MPDRARIAFITTPEYRTADLASVHAFISRYLFPLSSFAKLVMTGGTGQAVKDFIQTPHGSMSKEHRALISESMRFTHPLKPSELVAWKKNLTDAIEKPLLSGGVPGMIEAIYELVSRRIDAVIDLTHFGDVEAKLDSATLMREANVHDVPIASDLMTAERFVEYWISAQGLAKLSDRPMETSEREAIGSLEGLTASSRVLGLIAHDAKKSDICRFVVENAQEIFEKFDIVLATGTTGREIQRFLRAMKKPDKADRVRRCLSGPDGGDVQIAYAVLNDICKVVIFLQDPKVSHPHLSDIRLFEQAVLLKRGKVGLATNLGSASVLLHSYPG